MHLVQVTPQVSCKAKKRSQAFCLPRKLWFPSTYVPIYSIFYQKLPHSDSNSNDAISTTPPHSVSPCSSLVFTGLLPDTPATCSVVMTSSHLFPPVCSQPVCSPQQTSSCSEASCSRLQHHLAFVTAHLETVHCGKAAGRLLVTGSTPESRPLSAPSHTHCPKLGDQRFHTHHTPWEASSTASGM